MISLCAEFSPHAEPTQVPSQAGLRIHRQAVECAARRAMVAV